MQFDVAAQLGAVVRSVSSLEVDGKPARAVVLGRQYETSADDLWDALTNPERLARWFMPVSGDLTLEGRYELKGNAGGVITACEPPRRLELTWEFGGDVSWVHVALTADGPERTRLKLTHTAHLSDHWANYGPGATGVGWELGLFGLDLHVEQPDKPKVDEHAFAASEDGKAFTRASCEAWGEAAIVAGEEATSARAAAQRTAAFYTGEATEG